MKTKTATFYECGVRYDKIAEDGSTKKVTELYIVDALSFTEAESRIIDEMAPYINGEFDVVTIKRTRYSEFVDNPKAVVSYYKVKIVWITVDEKTEKEKKTAVYWLVPADNIGEARKIVMEQLGSSTIDFEIKTLDETKYIDVFLHDSAKKKE